MKTSVSHNRRAKVLLFTVLFFLSSVFTMLPDKALFANLIASAAESTEAVDLSCTGDGNTFSWDNATVYFLLTDRFNNGNEDNDHSYNRGLDANGNVVTGIDESATFHGGDFAGITQKIEEGYFTDLGVNALWISAPYEQIHGYLVGSDDTESFAHYAYHGYYALDYTQTDENFGTEEEFRTLVDTAHENNIRIVLDVVMNHVGYNTIYDMDEYGFGTLNDGWQDYYASHTGINNATYHSFIDYDTSSSDWANWWGNKWVRAGVAGYDSAGSSNLDMCLSGLPDLKTESTEVAGIPAILANKWKSEGRYDEEVAALNQYLAEHNQAQTVTNTVSYWLSTWVREYGVDGFRCDTAKHVDLTSWNTLKEDCVEALREWKAENPDKALDDLDFWMTGEVWDQGVYKNDYYTVGGFDSLINFSTQGAGLLASGTVADVYEGFSESINSDDSFNVLSYISSHDSVLARGNSIYNGSAFLLLPGGIQIYYGDETDRPLDSNAASNGQHNLRSDMNWDSMNEATLAHWQKVSVFRNNHIAIGAGSNESVSSTSGIAFTRFYNKNGIIDKAAACINAGTNKSVTIDVSGLWKDGQTLVNAYDSTQAVVTDGTVTFNSGENGTILIQEPDGKPLVSVSGDAKFHDTQTVTLSLTDAEYAKVSVDGAKKFVAYDGDTFEIGATAYEGDTVKVTVEAENEKGKVKSVSTFYKAYADETIDSDSSEETEESKAVVHVKTYDGSAPYVYAWTGSSTALGEVWPGDLMTETDESGYYVIEYDTTDTYSVVINNGSGVQTADIASLKGEVWIEITSSAFAYSIIQREYEAETKPITIHVNTYDGTAPFLYIWDDAGNTYNGGFPGTQVTTTDEAGWYTIVVDSLSSSVNCIVNKGDNQSQTGNITGISSEAWITITSEDGKTYEVENTLETISGMTLLKTETRAIKNMSAEYYTDTTWNNLYALVDDADAVIAQGEDADDALVEEMIEKIQSAKASLILVSPVVTVSEETASFSGTAPCEAQVVVEVSGGKTYTVTADDITGEWTVNLKDVSEGTQVKISAVLNGVSSVTKTYTVLSAEEGTSQEETSEEESSEEETTVEEETSKEETSEEETTVDEETSSKEESSSEAATEPETESVVVTTGNKVTIYYYTDWDMANIHYQIGSGSWTEAPGVKMTDVNGKEYKMITLDMGTEETVTCCFNNGNGTWDNNNGNNYTITKGNVIIIQGITVHAIPAD